MGLLLLRLFAGLTMAFAHGWGKVPPSSQLVEGVTAIGFPLPGLFAWLAAVAEFGGGLLIAFGLLTRPAALMLAMTMSVAGFVVHAADPFNVKEMAFLYLFISIYLIFRGAGRYSLDAVIHRTK